MQFAIIPCHPPDNDRCSFMSVLLPIHRNCFIECFWQFCCWLWGWDELLVWAEKGMLLSMLRVWGEEGAERGPPLSTHTCSISEWTLMLWVMLTLRVGPFLLLLVVPFHFWLAVRNLLIWFNNKTIFYTVNIMLKIWHHRYILWKHTQVSTWVKTTLGKLNVIPSLEVLKNVLIFFNKYVHV